MAYQVGSAFVQEGGAVGPWLYDGTLFVVAATQVAENTPDHTIIGIFKSTDGGATWTQTGGTKTLPSSADSGGWYAAVNSMDDISGCLDIDFPANPYGYVCHCDTDCCLRVSRLNMEAEDWDAMSDQGPSIFASTFLLGGTFLHWLIEQSTTGRFGILASIWPNAVSIDQVFALSLESSLSGWSSRTEMIVPGAARWNYTAAAVARGTDGRIHGFMMRDNEEVYHGLVLGGGGSLGSTFSSLTDGDWIFQSGRCGIHTDDGKIGFLFAKETGGLGAFGPLYKVAVAIADSADSPSFTITEIDTVPQSPNSYWAGTLTAAGNDITAAWSRGIDDDQIHFATYSGGAWGEVTDSPSGLNPFIITGTQHGVLFGVESGGGVDDDHVLWFYPFLGFTLAGLAGIPSEEEFGKTHGLTGGGPGDTCGTLEVQPSAPGCNPVPSPPTVPPGQNNGCPTVGLAF